MPGAIQELFDHTEHQNLIKCEGADEKKIDLLFSQVHAFLEENKFVVCENDELLSTCKNSVSHIYKNITTFNEDQVRNNEGVLLCATNGKEIIYGNHQNHGDCCKSIILYNILHIGCGHLWQWSCSDKSSGLRYTGTKAWRTGKKIYNEINSTTGIRDIINYEKEAILISLKNLESIYSRTNLDDLFKAQFLKCYTYYSLVDLNALVSYFRTHRHTDIFKLNKFDINELDIDYSFNLNFRLNIKKRNGFQQTNF